MWSILFLESDHNVRKLKQNGFRLFITIYILMMFIACSGYTGNLNSLIAVPVQPKLMKKLKDVAQSDMPVYQLDFMIPIMKEDYLHEEIHKILENVKPYSDFDSTFNLVREGKAQMFTSAVKFNYHQQEKSKKE